MLRKFLILLSINFLFVTSASSQEDELGAWYIYNGFFKFSPKIEFFFETQLRNYEVFGQREAFYVRPYFTYNVVENFQLGVSTEYHQHYEYNPEGGDQEFREEFRIDLQAILAQQLGRVSLQHRYRYEFRNINSSGGRRMRYRFQLTVPINKKSLSHKAIFFNTNIEAFINTQPEWDFDQNRLYGGIGYFFTPSLNFQVGYMVRNKTGYTDHRLWFFLTHRMSFEKDKD